MRKRTLEHVFKHTLLFIAILLPLIIAFSALYTSVDDVSYEYVRDKIDEGLFLSASNYRSYSFMVNLISFFEGAGLRPFQFLGFDVDSGTPIINSDGFNPITYGIFQLMGYLMGQYNQVDVLVYSQFISYDYGAVGDITQGYLPALPYGSAYVLCEYLGYIFYVYVFYFLIELFLFVPRLGTELGDKLIHSGHSKGGDIEW